MAARLRNGHGKSCSGEKRAVAHGVHANSVRMFESNSVLRSQEARVLVPSSSSEQCHNASTSLRAGSLASPPSPPPLQRLTASSGADVSGAGPPPGRSAPWGRWRFLLHLLAAARHPSPPHSPLLLQPARRSGRRRLPALPERPVRRQRLRLPRPASNPPPRPARRRVRPLHAAAQRGVPLAAAPPSGPGRQRVLPAGGGGHPHAARRVPAAL